ncbi:MAG: hypothetical protein H6865_08185 [Rhodospirillales bacterium]|nr:hypothetical protein [Alphaproteobacteria bacterium]MCB9987594.1 hypothetical protein [Rhodospirillales bacterium]USO07691.1 MAG: hypothetical protein H6866_00165 [Rhodospirillales bacterium]
MTPSLASLEMSPLRTDFLHAAGTVIYSAAQRLRIIRTLLPQITIGGPGEPGGLRRETALTPRRPQALETLDAREYNRLLHFLRIQMAISRWGGFQPRDWFDRTGLHFRAKQRAITLRRLAAAYRRAFS